MLFSPCIFANEFDWAYKEFLRTFEARQLDDLAISFTENTLLGFGPDEVGFAAFLQKYQEDERCFQNMVTALRLGCRLDSEGNTCSAPPLAEDASVIGIEARAKFVMDNGQIFVSSFICAGD